MSKEEAIKILRDAHDNDLTRIHLNYESDVDKKITNARWDCSNKIRKAIKLLESALADKSEPEPIFGPDPRLMDIAISLHKIYEPNCVECSYSEKDWSAVKKVILPLIDRIEAEIKELREQIDTWRTFGCPKCRKDADL